MTRFRSHPSMKWTRRGVAACGLAAAGCAGLGGEPAEVRSVALSPEYTVVGSMLPMNEKRVRFSDPDPQGARRATFRALGVDHRIVLLEGGAAPHATIDPGTPAETRIAGDPIAGTVELATPGGARVPVELEV